MKIRYFTHSLLSCWNHGNAHFLRGVIRELMDQGHDVQALEPAGNWSLSHLLADHGTEGLAAFHRAYPDLQPRSYSASADRAALVDDADVVIVHEWNDPALVAALGEARRHGRFLLFFHDTHHRAVSDPQAMRLFDLSCFDGILAFGEALTEVYRRWGWGDRVWTWHEAADARVFFPHDAAKAPDGLIWIGNWGDGERTRELETFLLQPAADTATALDVFGVRYPDDAKAILARAGATYHGWAPNAAAPSLFACHLATVHVPRRFYAAQLPGIPTIRVFEALACGIPLLTAPWSDAEGLFRPGDYLVARSGDDMNRHIRAVRHDPDLRSSLRASGLETIRARHTCAHRVRELMAIVSSFGGTERNVA